MRKLSLAKETKTVLYRETERKFDALLQKSRTVPISEDNLFTELVILYNWSHQKCLQYAVKKVPCGIQPDVVHGFLQSLTRVQKYLAVSSRDTHHVTRATSQSVCHLIDLCSPKIADLPGDNLSAAFILVCCLWVTVLLHDGEKQDAIHCLESLQNNLELKVKCEPVLSLVFPGGPVFIGSYHDNSCESLHLSEVVYFLFAICFYANEEWDCCRQYAQKVGFEPWTPYTKYLTGVTLFKAGDYAESVKVLDCAKGDNSDKSVTAMTVNLIGSCFAKMGHPHSAIQKYREAVDIDFSFLLPVYNISVQYQKLQLFDAELESLNLLVTTLENEHKKSQASQNAASDRGVLCDLLGAVCSITLIQGTYALAKRCLELKRYDVASEKYLDLLSHVEEYGFPEVKYEKDVVRLPTLQKIYLESVYGLLCAGSYNDCIDICDRLLLCQTETTHCRVNELHRSSQAVSQQNELDNLDFEPQSQTPVGRSRKRQRSGFSQTDYAEISRLRETSNEAKLLNGLEGCTVALLYKGDALVQLERYKEAAECLHRAVEKLEFMDSAPFSPSADLSQTAEPKAKRQRLSSDSSGMSSEKTETIPTEKSFTLAGLYEKLGITLALQGQNQEALHFLRLCLQLSPGNIQAVYNTTLVLWKLGRKKEAALGWADARKIEIRADSFYLSTNLRSKQANLKSLGHVGDSPFEGVASTITPRQMLQLDISCLEYLIKSRRGFSFT
ncbi:hypothetical protein ScPMuIL_011821 [Solemya velum]